MKPTDNNNEQEPQQPFDPFQEFAFESYQALLKDRTILLNSDVKADIIEKVLLPLTTLSQKNTKPIKLLINSRGGEIEVGQAVVDAIQASPAPIITVAMGQAMSAAFDIFLAGDHRVVYTNTLLMCHSGGTAMAFSPLPQINIEAKLHEAYFERWSKWYASRTKIAEKEWMSLLSTGLNKYWFPEQALKDGLVHEIIKPIKKNLSNLPKLSF